MSDRRGGRMSFLDSSGVFRVVRTPASTTSSSSKNHRQIDNNNMHSLRQQLEVID
jgi:hypothetical protein